MLSYCEALMQSAAAYRPVTPEESLECAKCALEQGVLYLLEQTIACLLIVSYMYVLDSNIEIVNTCTW